MSSPSNRIKVWRDSNLETTPQLIDPTHTDGSGNYVGYPCDRILLIPNPTNSGYVYLWDESTSPEMYAVLPKNSVVELWITNTNMIRLSGSAVAQGVSVVIERKVA